VAQAYEYDAFGRLHDRMNAVKQPYAFTGREWDRETGLYYYRARYYDPETGRFTSKDPIGINGGDVNFYAYVGNNPVNDTDPMGWYGTRRCDYYALACARTGGRYECGIAQTACGFFRFFIHNTLDCIRQCLQEKHKERLTQEGRCRDIVDDHELCIGGCIRNSENPYDANGQDLPDMDIVP
jgi:RHS repeat-associated protein